MVLLSASPVNIILYFLELLSVSFFTVKKKSFLSWNDQSFFWLIYCFYKEQSDSIDTYSFTFQATTIHWSYETLFFIVCKVVQHWQKYISQALPMKIFYQKNITKKIYITLS